MTRRKNKRLRLTPSHLPLIRDKFVTVWRERAMRQYEAKPQYRRILDGMWSEIDQMSVAQLWWISRDMAKLAADTAAQGDFPRMQAPAASGVMFLEGGVPVDTSSIGITSNVAGFFWDRISDGETSVMAFTDDPESLRKSGKEIEMITIRIEKTRGHKWNETGTFALEFPKSELRKRVYDCQLDKDGETEDAWLCIPSERLRAKYERLVADEESTQSDYDKLYEELSAYSDTLTTEQLMDWFIDLNDPETISGWTERIEAHNAYIDVMEPNNAVLRNPLDVDSTFHISIYDYFIDFHEDREIVDDLEFTPSDVEADDWMEDIKRCLEENG